MGFTFRPEVPRIPFSFKLQIILLDKAFSCFERVVAWSFRLSSPRIDAWFLLQVWRPFNDHFLLVNSTNITTSESNETIDPVTQYELDEDIIVNAGDIIGVFAPMGSVGFPIAGARVPLQNASADASSALVYNRFTEPPTKIFASDAGLLVPALVINLAAITGT